MDGVDVRPIAVALVAVWLATEGDIQLARTLRGLGQAGALETLLCPGLWLAIAMLAGHFGLWLYVLSRLQLSVAIPLTACNYVFNAILVQFRLGEQVSPRVWLGTLLIAAGVVLVTRSASTASQSSGFTAGTANAPARETSPSPG